MASVQFCDLIVKFCQKNSVKCLSPNGFFCIFCIQFFQNSISPRTLLGSLRRSTDPLVGWGYPLPISPPLDAFGISLLGADSLSRFFLQARGGNAITRATTYTVQVLQAAVKANSQSSGNGRKIRPWQPPEHRRKLVKISGGGSRHEDIGGRRSLGAPWRVQSTSL